LKPATDDLQKIECGEKSYTFEMGDIFYYQFHRHGSVGEDADFQISDSQIVEHIETKTEYLHPEKMKPGWTGGDGERGQWFFKAIHEGKAILLIRVLFRFEVESECAIEITVK
jgi:hypothetical protein